MSDPIAKRFASERGMALVVTLITLVVVVVLGLAVLQNSVSGLRTSGNDRQLKSAVALAEAGVEYTRETLRTKLRAGQTINQLLSQAANGGSLLDSTTLAGFGSTTPTSNGTSNKPVVPSRGFGSGNFQVFLTNDLMEGGSASASVEKITDSNGRIMITSFAGPKGSIAVAQAQLALYQQLMPGANMPGLITMPGPTVNFQSFASNARFVRGYPPNGQSGGAGCYPTIAVTTNAAKIDVDTVMCTPGNCSSGQYTSCKAFGPDPTTGTAFFCPTNGNGNGTGNGNGVIQSAGGSNGQVGPANNPSTENFLSPPDNPYSCESNTPRPIGIESKKVYGNPDLVKVSYLKELVNNVFLAADCCKPGSVYTCPSTANSSCSSPYGTPGTGSTPGPMIVAIDGDFTLRGNESGAGILLVTGKLTFSGTPTYTGAILVIGDGNFEQNGAGNGTINGAILVANINAPWNGTWDEKKTSCTPNKGPMQCVADCKADEEPRCLPLECYVGTPTYNINGGGSSEFYYSDTALEWKAAAIMPLDMISFRLMH